jgi:transcription elongation factor
MQNMHYIYVVTGTSTTRSYKHMHNHVYTLFIHTHTHIYIYIYRTDDMLGKTVKLIKGQYKGHLGIVVEATETHVKVEMSTKHKILTVERCVYYHFHSTFQN